MKTFTLNTNRWREENSANPIVLAQISEKLDKYTDAHSLKYFKAAVERATKRRGLEITLSEITTE